MVAMYERAIKDIMQCISSQYSGSWEFGYDALCWFLSDEKTNDNYYPFVFVCEVLGWDTSEIRRNSAKLLDFALVLKMRNKLLSIINCAKKIKSGKWEKAYGSLCWALDNSNEDGSFNAACRCFNLDPDKARKEIAKILKGKSSSYFSTLYESKYKAFY